MGIEKRIEKLEKRTGATERPFTFIFVVYDGDREPSQEERGRACEDYTKRHGLDGQVFGKGKRARVSIQVESEEAKTLTTRILNGEGHGGTNRGDSGTKDIAVLYWHGDHFEEGK